MDCIGVSMRLPDGKQPGFYAQIVKGLAGSVVLFDRDKEMLIVRTDDERDHAMAVLGKYKVEADELPLLLLPDGADVTAAFEDYGFITRAGNRFLYADRCALFRLEPDRGDAERSQAVQQIEEHLIARFPSDGEEVYAADRDLSELMSRTAAAYGCRAVFVA